MDQRRIPKEARDGGEVVDFDEALLDACAPDVRADLLTEAGMLAKALAPEERARELRDLADSLCGCDTDMPRLRARRLAAALRHVARSYEARDYEARTCEARTYD